MSRLWRLIPNAGAHGLALATIVTFLAFVPSDANAGRDPCPDGGQKIDVGGPMSFTCPEGQVITGICIKAGQDGFGVGEGETGSGEGCYEFSEIGGSVGSVAGGGTGRDCKTISHSHFYCSEGEPPSEPVCGNEIVEAGEQCDPPGRISELFFCNEACQLVEVPEPTEPVCGNEVVEAGEQCDPPGPINELLFCAEGCQIVGN